MKVAKVEIVTIEIICPACGETIPEPDSGSLHWAINELRTRELTCTCGVTSRLPKKY